MDYVLVEMGQVLKTKLPTSCYLKSGRAVSGYHNLPEKVLRAEGWLPLHVVNPIIDTKKQKLGAAKYEIKEDQVIKTYEVVDKPEDVPVIDPFVEIRERLDKLEKKNTQ